MPLQYLQDDTGKTTAVVIPIDEWITLTERHADLDRLNKASLKKNKKPSDFKGVLSPELAEALQKHVQQSREQWD